MTPSAGPAPGARVRPVPFATDRYDRDAARRSDPDWWRTVGADPRARALVLGPGRVATDGDRVREVPLDEADALAAAAGAAGWVDGGVEVQRMYLGQGPDGPVAAVSLPHVPDALVPRGVREVAPGLDPVQASLLVHALALANWHRTHRFCARCGHLGMAQQAGHVRRCPSCGTQHFPRTDPAVIMLVTDDDDRALLGHAPQWPAGRFSTLAGFVEPGESLEDAVRREVGEEVGVQVGEVRYAASQPWPFPTSLMLGFFAHATSTRIRVDGDEVTSARWFSRSDLSAAAGAGELLLPGEFSISRWLVTRWHGGDLPGSW